MKRPESRWPPALAVVLVLLLVATLPGHVTALPVWVSYLAALAVLVPMAAVRLTAASTLWLGIERTIIILLAFAFIPLGSNAFSLYLHPWRFGCPTF